MSCHLISTLTKQVEGNVIMETLASFIPFFWNEFREV